MGPRGACAVYTLDIVLMAFVDRRRSHLVKSDSELLEKTCLYCCIFAQLFNSANEGKQGLPRAVQASYSDYDDCRCQ